MKAGCLCLMFLLLVFAVVSVQAQPNPWPPRPASCAGSFPPGSTIIQTRRFTIVAPPGTPVRVGRQGIFWRGPIEVGATRISLFDSLFGR